MSDPLLQPVAAGLTAIPPGRPARPSCPAFALGGEGEDEDDEDEDEEEFEEDEFDEDDEEVARSPIRGRKNGPHGTRRKTLPSTYEPGLCPGIIFKNRAILKPRKR